MMKNEHIFTIDQSTAATKLLVFNTSGEILFSKSIKHKQVYPYSGWVEQCPSEIYNNVVQLLNTPANSELKCKLLTLTNQRETIILWNKKTGKPIYNAIVWQCNRTTEMCNKTSNPAVNKMIFEKTGLSLNPYFSATKIKWILDNVKEANELIEKDLLLCGTIDSWIIWNLTNKEIHATDITNASRTLLFNINDLKWDADLLNLFKINKKILPHIKYSDGHFGNIKDPSIKLQGVPISGVVGDSQSAFYAQQCFNIGDGKATFGTGTSIIINTGNNKSKNSRVANSIGWGINNQVKYAQEGLINSSGDILNWLMNDLQLIDSVDDIEELIKQSNTGQQLFLIPAFNGLATPFWNYNTKAAFYGISRDSSKADFVKACVEAIAYQVMYVLDFIVNSSHTTININKLKVDGGATVNHFLMQLLANLLDRKIYIANLKELSAMGSYYIGGEKHQLLNLNHIKTLHDNSYTAISPNESKKEDFQKYTQWKALIENHITNKSLYF